MLWKNNKSHLLLPCIKSLNANYIENKKPRGTTRATSLEGMKTLKARYGGSFGFTMTTSSDNEEEVEHMVRRLSPMPTRYTIYRGHKSLSCQRKRLELQMYFKLLKKQRVDSQFMLGGWLIQLWRMCLSKLLALLMLSMFSLDIMMNLFGQTSLLQSFVLTSFHWYYNSLIFSKTH